ncbi:hypothetical protein [Arsenicibacter rosenii]|nr:hypothetical protein [Arsenicibacter rosenii]
MKAKLKCIKVEHFEGSQRPYFQPVTADCEENKTFSKYTPVGNVDFLITNPALFGQYESGKEYYLTLTPVASDSSIPIQ